VRENITLDWQTASKHLFDQPLKLLKCISGYPFARGVPPSRILQRSAVATVFKNAIACNGIFESSFENKELKKALQNIWRNGWLHAEKSNNDVRYIFATQVHRW
jgi:hypothetical protein